MKSNSCSFKNNCDGEKMKNKNDSLLDRLLKTDRRVLYSLLKDLFNNSNYDRRMEIDSVLIDVLSKIKKAMPNVEFEKELKKFDKINETKKQEELKKHNEWLEAERKKDPRFWWPKERVEDINLEEFSFLTKPSRNPSYEEEFNGLTKNQLSSILVYLFIKSDYEGKVVMANVLLWYTAQLEKYKNLVNNEKEGEKEKDNNEPKN